jgi:hypothetical protein
MVSKFFTDVDDFELVGFDSSFLKHGTHDQKTHGNWATGATPNSITTTTNAIGQEIQTITYGDITFEREKPGDVRDTEDMSRFMWTTYSGNDAMRIVASRVMGIENPSPKSRVLSEGEIKSLVEGGVFQAGSLPLSEMEQGLKRTISSTYTLLEDIHTAEPLPETLHRGIQVKANSSIMKIKEGEVLEMPISSTSTKRRTAELYATEYAGDWEIPVFFTFAKGTKGVPIRFSQMADGSAVAEYVTQGKFRVVSVDKSSLVFQEAWDMNTGIQSRKSGAVEIVLEHTDTYSIEKGGYESVKP